MGVKVKHGDFIIVGATKDLDEVVVPNKVVEHAGELRHPLVGIAFETNNDFEQDRWGVVHSGVTGCHIVSKMLYKTTKGYYYKHAGKRQYLSEEEEEKLKEFIEGLSEGDWQP